MSKNSKVSARVSEILFKKRVKNYLSEMLNMQTQLDDASFKKRVKAYLSEILDIKKINDLQSFKEIQEALVNEIKKEIDVLRLKLNNNVSVPNIDLSSYDKKINDLQSIIEGINSKSSQIKQKDFSSEIVEIKQDLNQLKNLSLNLGKLAKKQEEEQQNLKSSIEKTRLNLKDVLTPLNYDGRYYRKPEIDASIQALQLEIDAKQDTLPNFNTSEILFGDGSNVPLTSQYFNFNNAINQFTVGGNEVAGSFVLTNERADTTTPQTVNHNFRGFYNTNEFYSLGSQISVNLLPDSFGNAAEEIYITAKGNQTSIDFSPGDTGFGDTYYLAATVSAGESVVLAGGEYTSAIALEESYVTAQGFNYDITNNSKFQVGSVGLMSKTTRGFDIVLRAFSDENGDANTTLNDTLNGFKVFAQGQAKPNGTTQFIGFDFTTGFSGTSKAGDSFYGVRIINSSNAMPNATTYYSWYSEGGEMFVQSNLATRKNLTLKTAASQTARVLDIQSNTGVSQLGIAGNGRDFILDTTTGTKWGTSTSQKQGWWNVTPVVQPSAVADATGGAIIDTEARTAINALLARMRTLGLIAT